ncbi:hypothetical protein RUE5091_04206 [Ruegeria denitrificans]|uniref:Uncharacterized protein n=1 Tax=Ruegeria denitrificans TaxID=1715692 RepID=A0A0P1IJU8_9RHOB|nr:hypothetical protein RUE5091_04206 [Ruegeria denitrificans]
MIVQNCVQINVHNIVQKVKNYGKPNSTRLIWNGKNRICTGIVEMVPK